MTTTRRTAAVEAGADALATAPLSWVHPDRSGFCGQAHREGYDLHAAGRIAAEAALTALGSDVCSCEPVGYRQIAERLDVHPKTAYQWAFRGVLPTTTWDVGRTPAWCWPHVIMPWAETTKRL